MKKFILFFMASLALASCSKDDYTIKFSQSVTIDGYVYQEGYTPLQGVSVNLYVNGKSEITTTDENGHYWFKGLNAGTHIIRFEMAGYGSMVEYVEIKSDGQTCPDLSYTTSTMLYKFSEKLTTQIIYGFGQVKKPAANVDYKIILPSNFLNNTITGKTDENGNISVDSLPNVPVNLKVEFTEGNYNYYLSSGYSSYITNYPKDFDDIYTLSYYAKNSSIYVTYSNVVDDEGKPNDNFTSTDNIVFTFSKAIDVNNTSNAIVLYKQTDYYGTEEIAASSSWSDDNKTLTIDPMGSALEEGGNYLVYLKLYDSDGNSYPSYSSYTTFSFTVEGGTASTLPKVTNINVIYPNPIQYTTSYIQVQFDENPDAYAFQVFGQYDNSEFINFGNYFYSYSSGYESLYIYLTNLPDISVPSEGLFANGKEFKIIIRAIDYSGNKGPFSDVLTIKAN
ncbi:MAG: carboxypeptidase regulatory-like domain-containing protein [Bacteroidales bacterium]|nr:carboxypeptidase regulatory-like domain-containing protein [Bacteroidales bacterium]